MYEVYFNQIVKDYPDESYSICLVVAELERALAFASMLQKISTPEVKFEAIVVKPAKLGSNEEK